MPAINLSDRVLAVQYTGSNSAEIDGLITDFTIITETGGVLTFTSGGNNFIANTGDWVRYSQGATLNTHPTAFLNFAFIRNAVFDDLTTINSDIATINTTLTSLQSQITALSGTTGLRSAGILELPTLSIGATVNQVPLTVTLPSTTGRTIQAKLFASATLLGNLSITATSFASTSLVNVTVNNSALVTLTGARVLVTVT